VPQPARKARRLTQDWELAGEAESSCDWERVSTVDDEDFARIAD